MGVTIPGCSAQDSITAMMESLDEAGCLVVTDLADATMLEAVTRQLAPHFEEAAVKTADDTDDFYPGHTRRVTALVTRSEAVGQLILDPIVLGLCDGTLGEAANAYHLHVTAGLKVGRGARAQILHREEDPFRAQPSSLRRCGRSVTSAQTTVRHSSFREVIAGRPIARLNPTRCCRPRCPLARSCSGRAERYTAPGRIVRAPGRGRVAFRGLVVRTPTIGGAENAACFSYPQRWGLPSFRISGFSCRASCCLPGKRDCIPVPKKRGRFGESRFVNSREFPRRISFSAGCRSDMRIPMP